MSETEYLPIEKTEVYKRFEAFADWAWDVVEPWNAFYKRRIGEQFLGAADSICANIVEGGARGTTADSVRFFIIARASAEETKYWMRRAYKRNQLPAAVATEKLALLKEGCRLLNGLITYRRTTNYKHVVRESLGQEYEITDENGARVYVLSLRDESLEDWDIS